MIDEEYIRLSKKLDYIELWIENHEKNILPRFKEELLKCLEDEEFRNDFFIQLIPAMYKPLFYGCFLSHNKVDTVLTESPLMPGVLQQTQTIRPVDANKMIDHVPDIGKMIISKLDKADLSVSEDFIVLLTMQERMWLREKLIGKKRG